jgi:hypothetical protein
MSFTPQDIQLLKKAKQEGKTKEQALAMIASSRQTTPTKTEGGYSLVEAGGDIKETFMGVGEQLVKTGEDVVTRDIRKPDEGIVSRVVGTGADIFRGLGRTIGEGVVGVGKLALPQSGEDKVKEVTTDVATRVAEMEIAQSLMEEYNTLPEHQKTQVDNILGYLEGISEIGTAGFGTKVVKTVMNNVKRGVVQTGETIATNVSKMPTPELPITGATQIMKEQVQRIPRAIGRGVDTVKEAQERAVRIQQSTPTVKKAIESGLDERVVNTLTQSDKPTTQAYKEMVDIAGETSTGLKPKQQPSIVAGRAVESTYDILEAERKRIGGELNKEIANLPKGTVADMAPSLRQMESVLEQNGINIKGKDVSFAGKYSNAERARIKELVSIIREMPEQMTAKQVREMDSLFAKVQRESRMDGLQDIIVDVNGENKNLFQLFRESYTNQLENINPRIRELNKQYRDSRVLLDDIEDTILKGGNYESLKGVDQAQFAKTNLRRIMGEAQSSPAYTEILSKMDARARELGYTGAKAEDLIYFAEELRKIYPETIPKTGFQGGIRTGIGGSKTLEMLEKVMGAGKPNTVDQQRALREMLEDLTKEPVPTTSKIQSQGSQPVSSAKNTIIERANKARTQSGMVRLPFSGKNVKAIDAQTKKDIMEAIEYVKSNEYSLNKQRSFDALTRKYEIPVQSADQRKVLTFMRKLLDKTKTPEVLPATYTRN